jgi:hypothetical protein
MRTTATKSEIDEVVKFAHNGNEEIIETLDFRDGVRYAIEYLKRKEKYNKKLTPTENYVVSDIIGRAADALSWDSGTGYYEDGGNFIYRCSKSDYAALKRAYKKL